MVARERFSVAESSLRMLLDATPPPFRLVYVDAGSPPAVRRAIEELQRNHGFEILRHEGFLSPNEARNRGLQAASGRYVVFLDNDVLVSEGWLDGLVTCAEETAAGIVGPLYLHGHPSRGKIHMAGGEARIEERDGRRVLHEKHRHSVGRVADLGPSLRREPCEAAEFHCMLVRRSLLERIGPLDEGLLSLHEHIDLCLLARQAGAAVWFEPGAVVAYVTPPPVRRGDLGYFLLRWSRDWNRRSVGHLAAKWRLDESDDELRKTLAWADSQRKLALGRVARRLGRPFGANDDNWIANAADRVLEWLIARPAERRRGAVRRAPAPGAIPDASAAPRP